jgi:hypothetical protein
MKDIFDWIGGFTYTNAVDESLLGEELRAVWSDVKVPRCVSGRRVHMGVEMAPQI